VTIFKNPIQCDNCRNTMGFSLHRRPMGAVYCLACEDFVTHREEQREKDMEHYRHALSR
jgi:hypothetical protein